MAISTIHSKRALLVLLVLLLLPPLLLPLKLTLAFFLVHDRRGRRVADPSKARTHSCHLSWARTINIIALTWVGATATTAWCLCARRGTVVGLNAALAAGTVNRSVAWRDYGR